MPRKILYPAVSKPVFVPPTPSMGWLAAWSEPRTAAQTYRQAEVTKPVFVPPTPSFAWFRDFNNPQFKTAPRLQEPLPVEPVFVPPTPSTAWMREWALPLYRPIARQSEFAKPVFVPPAPSFSWFAEWGKPQYRPERRQDYLAQPVMPIAFTAAVVPMAWLMDWDRPVYRTVPRQSETAAPVFVPPSPSLSWYHDWSKPLISRNAPQQAEITKPVFVPPAPFVWSWLGEWDRPQFRVAPRQSEIAAPVFVPTPGMAWLMEWARPLALKLNFRTAVDLVQPLTIPLVPSTGWLREWERPLFSKLRQPETVLTFTVWVLDPASIKFLLHKDVRVIQSLVAGGIQSLPIYSMSKVSVVQSMTASIASKATFSASTVNILKALNVQGIGVVVS